MYYKMILNRRFSRVLVVCQGKLAKVLNPHHETMMRSLLLWVLVVSGCLCRTIFQTPVVIPKSKVSLILCAIAPKRSFTAFQNALPQLIVVWLFC